MRGMGDGQQWEVVANPGADDDETDSAGRGVSSHFDVKLGWGRWRFTLFSWDMNVRKSAHGNTEQQEQKRG